MVRAVSSLTNSVWKIKSPLPVLFSIWVCLGQPRDKRWPCDKATVYSKDLPGPWPPCNPMRAHTHALALSPPVSQGAFCSFQCPGPAHWIEKVTASLQSAFQTLVPFPRTVPGLAELGLPAPGVLRAGKRRREWCVGNLYSCLTR